MACKALDGQVAVPADDELRGLLDKYVCVRIVQMYGLDLEKYAFDGSLTWAIFLQNADGSIYARYGSRSGLRDKSDEAISLAGFKKTLRAGLKLHSRYDEDVAKTLKAKAGRKRVWKTPEEIPTLKERGLFGRRFGGVRSKQSRCIHCHMITTNELLSLRREERPMPDKKFWPYPMPREIGMRMDPKEMATIEEVAKGSFADRAGFREGDIVKSLQGQPILSIADVQWVLHNAGRKAVLKAVVERGGTVKTLELVLEEDWRRTINDWRWINQGLLRNILRATVRPSPDRKNKLWIQWADPATPLRKGDVIVAVEGRAADMNLGSFTELVFRKKSSGDVLKLTVERRGGKRDVELRIR